MQRTIVLGATLVGVGLLGTWGAGPLRAQSTPELEARAKAFGQLATCRAFCQNLYTALQMYSIDNAGQYPARLSKVVPQYYKRLPSCPAAGRDTYSVSYQVSPSFDAYTFCCQGSNHGVVGLAPDLPSCSSARGLDQESDSLIQQRKTEGTKPSAAWEPRNQKEIQQVSHLCLCWGNTRVIGEELKLYAADHGGHYPKKLGQLIPTYLKSIPKCPSARRDTYSPAYRVSATGDSYTCYCQGNNHQLPGFPADQPTVGTGRAVGRMTRYIDYAERNNLRLYNCLELMVRKPK